MRRHTRFQSKKILIVILKKYQFSEHWPSTVDPLVNYLRRSSNRNIQPFLECRMRKIKTWYHSVSHLHFHFNEPTDRYATGPSSRMEAAVCDRDNTDPCLFSCDPASSPQDIADVCQLLVISVSLQSLQEETQLCEVYINPDPDH